MMRRIRRRPISLLRGVLIALTVLGQLGTSLGMPMPSSPEDPNPEHLVRPCGCAVEPTAEGCCCGPKSCCAPEAVEVPTTSPDWLIGELVRRCSGLDEATSNPATAVPPTVPLVIPLDVPSERIGTSSLPVHPSTSRRPDPPPPRG